MRKIIFIFFIVSVSSCTQFKKSEKKKDSSQKVETINHYIEAIDKSNSSFSKKIMRGIELKLTSVDYIMTKNNIIVPIQHFEKVSMDKLDTNFQNIHKFLNLKKINNSNIPESNSVKVKLVFNTLEDDQHINVDITLFCKKSRPEWWQCAHPGIFEYPSAEDLKKGKKVYTADELVDKISELILKLTFNPEAYQ